MKSSLSRTRKTPGDEKKEELDEATTCNLENKVIMLENRLKIAENESFGYEELYKQEKNKVKSADEIEGQFRAELCCASLLL